MLNKFSNISNMEIGHIYLRLINFRVDLIFPKWQLSINFVGYFAKKWDFTET